MICLVNNKPIRAQGGEMKTIIVSVLALGLAVSAAAASAQSESDGGLEEIVVTAQKREQNIMDVPVAITAISGHPARLISVPSRRAPPKPMHFLR